ncbi:hypothetical protein [Actinoplanes sp. NPDC051411]|uniref:hypothetical protein n=1 Tax=Actinoplanes sp. NPDC051411 TaxID=3155522 RepID=UPI00341CB107
MTSYSVLPNGPRTIVVATWSGDSCDQSAKVTTLDDCIQAQRLAAMMTGLSEYVWEAAAFLDSHPTIEEAIGRLVAQLRQPQETISPVPVNAVDGCRHRTEPSHTGIERLLNFEAPGMLSTLSRAQRLTIADELVTDAAARTEALRTLPHGKDPAADSRVWQMCEVGRSTRTGEDGPLPEGAASWITRAWGPEQSPARRWGCREQLVRIEQLVAACIASGGRATAEHDPLEAHLVFGDPLDEQPMRVFYVHPQQKRRGEWADDPFTPLVIKEHVDGSGVRTLGTAPATDDDGFATLLGKWTRTVPYLRTTDTFVDPASFD